MDVCAQCSPARSKGGTGFPSTSYRELETTKCWEQRMASLPGTDDRTQT